MMFQTNHEIQPESMSERNAQDLDTKDRGWGCEGRDWHCPAEAYRW